ncbi:MAG: alpha-xylosidase [Lachnospiraceae bacterium]|nr:alpha-xylosidase [Lachnospiraceae bacterium]
MDFKNGAWILEEGVAAFEPKQIYEKHITKTEVTLIAPTTKILDKGGTLGGILLTIKITSPSDGVLRLQSFHHMGLKDRDPKFELDTEEKELETEEKDGCLTIKSGNISLVINEENGEMKYMRGDTLLTKSNLAFVKEDFRGMPYDTTGRGSHMAEQLSLGVGELVYGLGERFGAFVKNGQHIDIWNKDGGTSSDQSYKNIPFYMTNKGYGVFVNEPDRVDFEVASNQVSKVVFSVEGESLDYFIFDGPTMKDVLVKYTDLTGKPALPPQWSFGLWLSTSFTTDYDEKTVMSFIDGMLDRGIPLSVFHFDCCWMKEFHWTDFTFDEKTFPDPKGLIKRIHDKGIRVCVWINPYIAQASDAFKEGMEKGYFLTRENGDVWQWDMWQPGMAIVDFTNPDAWTWYQGKLKTLTDMGVDCFKTDFGERIPTDCVYHNGNDPKKMHNYYTYLYNKCVYEFLQKEKGEENALVFARSATAGGQKFPVHWGGDCWSDYEPMEQSLRGGLSLTSSGFGFWSHDIGGFEQTSTADVYKRWAAFGLCSSHSRLHGSSSYRVPWLYDEEAVEVVREFTRRKLSLLPYLYSEAVKCHKTGIPVMRSMALEFPEDRNCAYLDKQFMLGESILVAPVFREDSVAEYYLPKGKWINLFTGERREGGDWLTEKVDYHTIPMWIKSNTILATSNYTEDADFDFEKELELVAYDVTDAKCDVYKNGELLVTYEMKLTDEKKGEYEYRFIYGKQVHEDFKPNVVVF